MWYVIKIIFSQTTTKIKKVSKRRRRNENLIQKRSMQFMRLKMTQNVKENLLTKVFK